MNRNFQEKNISANKYISNYNTLIIVRQFFRTFGAAELFLLKMNCNISDLQSAI